MNSPAMRMALGAIGLVIVGALGPWVTLDADQFGGAAGLADLSESGLESDGVITLALALITGATLLLVRKEMVRRIAAGICAVLILVIAIIDVLDVTGTEVLGISPSVGWGLWLTLVGGILLDTAVVLSFIRRPDTVSA